MDNFLFIGLPYAAFILLVVGWINKSRNRSFQISSLSTQFLEGKKLFWGTQAFLGDHRNPFRSSNWFPCS